MRLGEMLIQQGHLTQDALDEALDWQVLYGGRLGSNLLELKLVEEEHLARALARRGYGLTLTGPWPPYSFVQD